MTDDWYRRAEEKYYELYGERTINSTRRGKEGE